MGHQRAITVEANQNQQLINSKIQKPKNKPKPTLE